MFNTLELTQLKSKDIKNIREKILEEQEGCCELCGDKITEKTGVSLDHQHMKKSEEHGPL